MPLHIMNLDGSDPRPITGPNEYVYGVSVSPDGKSIAFHADYRIHTARLDGSGRKEIARKQGELSFGTSWSPDGGWAVPGVPSAVRPGAYWSDIWIGRPGLQSLPAPPQWDYRPAGR
jgi:Tol biopolymer transport system component